MAEITINKRKVDDAVRVASHAVAQEVEAINPIEALVAFSQLVGRVIVAQEGTSLLHRDMIKLALSQIETTVKAGYLSKGKQAGEIDGD